MKTGARLKNGNQDGSTLLKNNIFTEIIDNLSYQLNEDELARIKNSKLHLGVFSEPYLTYMLNGTKTIESRFSKNKVMPYNRINKDDIVIVKSSGGGVVAYFTIKEVLFFDLEEVSISYIKEKYKKELCVDDIFCDLKKDSKYATLIFIKDIFKVETFKINKKGMNTWLIQNN